MTAAGPLALSLAAGALTTLSPCVFPLLPLVLGGAAVRHRAAPLAMGLGMVLSFTAAGVLLGAAGAALGLTPERLRTGGALLLLAFGAVMWLPALDARLGRALSPLAGAAQAAGRRLDVDSPWGALALGGLLGLVWSPCAGPLLGVALGLVATAGGAAAGALRLGVFGLGAALPLVAVAYASRARVGRARGWVGGRAVMLRRAFGALLGVVGVAILVGADRWLEARLTDWLPDAWIALTTAL